MRDTTAAGCGIAGPAAFVGAWLLAGELAQGYDPWHDEISWLAAEGASTRPLMTAGMLAFGALVPLWAPTLGDRLGSRALRRVATAAGLATLAVAALPLTDGGSAQDGLHAAAAGTSYVAMAATPLVAVPLLRRRGHTAAAAASLAAGLTSAAALTASVLVGDGGRLGSGALQRLGLTVVHGWHVAAAVSVLGRRGGRP